MAAAIKSDIGQCAERVREQLRKLPKRPLRSSLQGTIQTAEVMDAIRQDLRTLLDFCTDTKA